MYVRIESLRSARPSAAVTIDVDSVVSDGAPNPGHAPPLSTSSNPTHHSFTSQGKQVEMTTTHRITTTTAIILSLAAAGATTAAAWAAEDSAIAANRTPAIVYSRPANPRLAVSSAAISSRGSGKTAIARRVSSDTVPTPADVIAAQRAAANRSASLDRFALINVHEIPPATTSANSDPQRFNIGDAAIGAGITVGLVLLGAAGVLAARRRRQPVHT
jgi:hypothetical protein